MKNLISIAEHSDWLFEQHFRIDEKWDLHRLRVAFGKQPLELWMFVPCDNNGNVLEGPEPIHTYGLGPCDYEYDDDEILKYQQAEERCLFENINEQQASVLMQTNETIEDLVPFDLQLTTTAIKKIYETLP